MQPLRKDHVDHYKEFVRDEFSIASNHVEQEISQQAYDKVEEVGSQFAKELKLEKLISEILLSAGFTILFQSPILFSQTSLHQGFDHKTQQLDR